MNIEATVFRLLRDSMGKPDRKLVLSDRLIKDLQIDCDDLIFAYIIPLMQQLDIDIPDPEWLEIYTVGDIIYLLKKYKKIQEEARKRADTDWKNKSPVRWVTGRLDLNKPVLTKGLIFYPRYCFITYPEHENFYDTYNQRIDELIDREGIPDWSPLKRIPERAIALEILTKTGQNLSNFTHSSIVEKNLIKSVLNKWESGQPVIWSRLPDKAILLLGGNVSEKVGRIDVLDTEHMAWLASLEFLRKHCPTMPWDVQAN